MQSSSEEKCPIVSFRWPFGMLQLLATRGGGESTCGQWFLKISRHAPSSCQISRKCHKVHNPDIFLPHHYALFSRSNIHQEQRSRLYGNTTTEKTAENSPQIKCHQETRDHVHLTHQSDDTILLFSAEKKLTQ